MARGSWTASDCLGARPSNLFAQHAVAAVEHEDEAVEGNGRDVHCPSKVPLGDEGGIGGIPVKLVDRLRLDVGELFLRGRGIARLHVLQVETRIIVLYLSQKSRLLYHFSSLPSTIFST